MKVKQIVCDICGKPVKCRESIGYKLKKKRHFLDATYHNMDVCGRCMETIVQTIKKAKEGE